MKRLHTFNEFINESEKLEDLNQDQLDFLRRSIFHGTWERNPDGTIDVKKDASASRGTSVVIHYMTREIPVQFGKIDGDFFVEEYSYLTALKGFPTEVTGSLTLNKARLIKSLEGCPSKIGWSLYLQGCSKLESVKGAPKEIGGSFDCSDCPELTSLEGSPQKVGGSVWLNNDHGLKTLEGAPQEVGENFTAVVCSHLISLKGGPKKVGGEFNINHCHSLPTLEGAPQAKKIVAIACDSLPEDEVELTKDPELFQSWLDSGLSVEDFLHKKRGTVKGKEFGF